MSKYEFRTLSAHNIQGVSSYRNYIFNNSANENLVDWETYADAPGPRPVNGNGGSPTITWTKSNTNFFEDSQFLFTKDAANRQGEGVSYSFGAEDCDFVKPFMIQFDYRLVSGTFASSGDNTIPSDICIYMINGDTITVIEPNIRILTGGATTGVSHYTAFFQTAPSTNLRLAIHVATTSTAAYVLAFDNFRVTPSPGASQSTSIDFRAVLGSSTQSIPTATQTLVDIDTVRIDTAAGFDAGANSYVIQESGNYIIEATIYYAANSTGARGIYLYKNGGQISEWLWPASSATAGNAVRTILFELLECVAGDFFQIYAFQDSGGALNAIGVNGNDFTEIIVHKSQSSTLSNGNVIAFRASQDSGQSIPDSNATTIVWNIVTFDTTNSYNASTGVWTCHESGKYLISACTFSDNLTWDANEVWEQQLYINGAQYSVIGETRGQLTTTINFSASGDDTIDLVAGDEIEIRLLQNRGAASTVLASSANNHVSIEMIASPSQTGADQVITARATDTQSGAVPDTPTTFVFGTVSFDTVAGYDFGTGIYTVQESGFYDVSASIPINGSVVNAFFITVRLNGVLYKTLTWPQEVAANFETPVTISTMIQAVAKDEIDIQISESVNDASFAGTQELIIGKR